MPKTHDVAIALNRYLSCIRPRDELLASLLDLEPTFGSLARHLELRTAHRGETLLRQGEPAGGILLVVEGRAAAWQRLVSKEGEIGPDQEVNFFGPGDVLGEIAVVTKTPRISDVVASEPVLLLSLEPRTLPDLSHASAAGTAALLYWFARNAMEKAYRTSSIARDLPVPEAGPMPWRVHPDLEGLTDTSSSLEPPADPGEVEARLRALRCFKIPNSAFVPEALTLFKIRHFSKGTEILEHGDLGRSLLLLSTGHAGLITPEGSYLKSFRAEETSPNRVVFGEEAFLSPGPRSAAVRAGSDCTLLEFRRDDVPSLVRASPWLALYLHDLVLRVTCARLTDASTEATTAGSIRDDGPDWWFTD